MEVEEFNAMEVKPKSNGWYFTTLYQFNKKEPEHPDYIRDWVEFDGSNWDYAEYESSCYVCFIHKRDKEQTNDR